MRGDAVRVTIACPEVFTADANQLALCFGRGPDDVRTYGLASWQDAAGRRYAVASTLVSEGFAATAGSPLTEPPWGADMAAAARAQALIQIDTAAGPDRIAAVFGDEAAAALAVLGLARGEVEIG
jgi:hypothetical protein